MIKAIVTDMDGTLLDPNNNIPKTTIHKLLELEEKGIRIILASGRNYNRLMKYVDLLEMRKYNGYLIEVDGVAIYDVGKEKREVLQRMDMDAVQKIFYRLMELDVEIQACFDDGMFAWFSDSVLQLKTALRKERNLPDDFPWTSGPWDWLTDMRDGYPKQYYIKDPSEIFGPINKIQIMQEPDVIAQIYDILINEYGNRYEFFRTCPRQIEILTKGVSKGSAFAHIMSLNGWKTDEIAAFGDGENDVSLFEHAAYSFAMGQAEDFIKDKANYVTLSNAEEGLLEGIHRMEEKGCI